MASLWVILGVCSEGIVGPHLSDFQFGDVSSPMYQRLNGECGR